MLKFRLDAYIVLNRFEKWLESLTAWMDKPRPGCDEGEMQSPCPASTTRTEAD